MKLTQHQTEQLYKFTRKHYVEWYDLQTELVDHLANGIEEQWQNNPNIDFETALQKEFKKFGVFGFMEVVEQRQKALSKKYMKIMFGFVKEWFKLPKIIASLTLTYVLFLMFRSDFGSYFYFALVIAMSVYIFFKAIKMRKEFNYKEKATGRKWMFEEMIFKSASSNVVVFVVNMYNIYQFSNNTSNWVIGTFAIIAMLMILTSYITLSVIPKESEKLLQETYPEYNFQ